MDFSIFSTKVCEKTISFIIGNLHCRLSGKRLTREDAPFEPDCYSYPLAHARHYQFYERRQERAQESRDYTSLTRPRIQ